ncbi:MAG: hypothetical protein JOZ41_20475, partial [Chloroflexi bacterium]|nr:hypothetical protein [Chloroflexota bacterium]
MSSREQEQEAVESEDGLRAQREALEADLLELARLIEAEHTEWQAWR